MRSLRARVLVVMLLVAVLAVAVTAFITNRTTSSDLRDAVAEDLLAEDVIYEELTIYSLSHPSWQGVEPLVDELAARYDKRVALATLSGSLIADSAGTDGDGLPSSANAVIDPANPFIGFDSVGASTLEDIEAINTEGEALAKALAAAGADFEVTKDQFGIVFPVWDELDPTAAAIASRFYGFDVAPDEIAELIEKVGELVTALEGAGVKFEIPIDGGLTGFPLFDQTDPATGELFSAFLDSLDTDVLKDLELFAASGLDELLKVIDTDFLDGFAGTIDIPGFAPTQSAEPALLFTANDADDALLPTVLSRRTLLAAAVVAVGAFLVALVVSGRLLRPIDALTAAAEGMGAGDLQQRVPIDDRSELGELATAFNSMADSLETGDRLRRQMTSDIAHELRTPLANIRGWLEATQEGVAEATPDLINSIHEEAIHLQHLIDDLEDLAKAEAGGIRLDRRAASVSALVEQSVEALRLRADANGVGLSHHVDADATASVDAKRIRQVLANLLENALRHTEKGGSVTVTTAVMDGAVQVSVADTGVGISQEHLPHIFERFYRADPSRTRATGGSGLGLAISKYLVEAHGGTLGVKSEPGVGSQFSMTLPRVTEV